MNPTLLLILRILAIAISAAGIGVVFLAPSIVDRRGLAAGKTLDPHLVAHLQPEEQEKFRRESAILDVKLRGLLIGLPGFILILIAFAR